MPPNYRRCISCHRVAPKNAFWRIVRTHPGREVKLEEGMGRSAYLCPQESCLHLARQKNRLGRALRITVPDHIYQTLEEALTQKKTSSNGQ